MLVFKQRLCASQVINFALSAVSRHASEQDIKKAYKRLSRKYHPDKNSDPGAEDRFVEVAHGKQICLLLS